MGLDLRENILEKNRFILNEFKHIKLSLRIIEPSQNLATFLIHTQGKDV